MKALDKSELERLFLAFDTEVKRQRISVNDEGILLSNLILITRPITQDTLLDYLRQVVDLLESTAEFVALDEAIAQYFRQGKLSGRRKSVSDSGLKLNPELVPYIDDTDYLDGPPAGPLRNWMRLSGYYEAQIVRDEQIDWLGAFTDFLDSARGDEALWDYFLAIDGLRGKGLKIGSALLIDESDHEFAKLCETANSFAFPDYFTIVGGAPPSRAQLKEFVFLHKRSRCQIDLHSRTDTRRPWRVFEIEAVGLILVLPWKVGFADVYALPTTYSYKPAVDYQQDRRTGSSLNFGLLQWCGFSDEEIRQHLFEHTLSVERFPGAQSALDRICSLLTRHMKALRQQANWLLLANNAKAGAESFLLSTVALESLLIAKGAKERSSDIAKNFCTRFSRLLSNSEAMRGRLESYAQKIYDLRSQIVHGSSKDLSYDLDDVYNLLHKQTPQESRGNVESTLRDRLRRLFLVSLLIMETLQNEDSRLRGVLRAHSKCPPTTWKGFLRIAFEETEWDDSFWDSLYSDIGELSATASFDGRTILL